MASPDALKALVAALVAEQARRRKAQYSGHDDPLQWLLDELAAMAQRLAAPIPMHPLDLDDLSPAELLSLHLLPRDMQPPGLPSEAEIWAQYQARSAG